MSYTIAVLEDVHNEILLDYGKNGNKYQVGLYNKETKEYTHKKYDNATDAIEVFQKISNAIMTGCYSYKDRKSMIKGA